MTTHHTQRILFITLSNIGDAVMTTPVIVALHNKYPQAVIDVVCDARSHELFSHLPSKGELFLKNKQTGWRSLAALLKQLRRTHYDLVVDLRTDGLTLLLRAERRLTRRTGKACGTHAVQRHFGVIGPHEGISDCPATRLWLSEQEHRFASETLADVPGKHWLALGSGARWAPKRWPAPCYGELVNRLPDRFDAVVLLGSAADADDCRQLSAAMAMPCINLAGQTTLLQAAAVLQKVRLFIGSDSGLGHIAAAVGTATLTLFGPGDPARYHPWHPQARWIQSKGGDITDISIDDVIAALNT